MSSNCCHQIVDMALIILLNNFSYIYMIYIQFICHVYVFHRSLTRAMHGKVLHKCETYITYAQTS